MNAEELTLLVVWEVYWAVVHAEDQLVVPTVDFHGLGLGLGLVPSSCLCSKPI